MGKGLGSSAVPPHAGISCDLRQLYRKFLEMDSVRLRDFGEVYRSLDMNKIWYGRQSSAELIEFSERLLQMSVTYMCSTRVSSTDPQIFHQHSLPERIFGVYACFTFFFLQPQDYVCRIRITPDEMREIREFWENVLVPKRHLDAAACVYKLLDADAFKIVPFRLCFDPACHKRYDVPDCDDDIGDDEEAPFTAATAIISDPLLKQISLLHENYEEGKKQFNGLRSHKDIFLDLHETVNAVKQQAQDEESKKEGMLQEDLGWTEDSYDTSGNSSKSRIKDKAYTSKIKHSRGRRYADPEMHKAGDPNEKRTPSRKRQSITANPEVNNDEDQLKEDSEVQMIPKDETPKQESWKMKRAKTTMSKRINLAMQEKLEKAAKLFEKDDKKKGLTPLAVLADPMAAAAIENRDFLPPVADENFQKVLNGFKDSAETQAVEDEMRQLLSEAGPAAKRARATSTPSAKLKKKEDV